MRGSKWLIRTGKGRNKVIKRPRQPQKTLCPWGCPEGGMRAEQLDRRITIGVNQYIIIIHLFIYEQRITSKVYITILHILWVILAVLNLLGNYVEIIFWSICKELVIVIALISLTIVGYFYACILLKARQVRSQISSWEIASRIVQKLPGRVWLFYSHFLFVTAQ